MFKFAKEKLKRKAYKLDFSLNKNIFYIDEKNYKNSILNKVEPYLEKYKKTGYCNPKKDIYIYYEHYINYNSSKVVVISHGFTGFGAKYTETIYYFLKKGYSVFIMDHRGHGNSTREVDDLSLVHIDDFDYYVEDFAFFVKTVVKPIIKEKECILYAHSMGGAIGARVLQKYPNLFDKAILSSPMMEPSIGYPKILIKIITRLMIFLGKGKDYVFTHHSYDGIRDYNKFSSTSEVRFNSIFDKIQNNNRYQTYGGSFKWVQQSLNVTDQILKIKNLEKIKIPVLVFQAERDTLVEASGIYKFVNNVPSSKLIFVPKSKHELFSAKNKILIPYFNSIFKFINK